MVQSSHPYMTTGNIIALTVWTFVSKVMSLLFNMLSIFIIAFLPGSKHLFIWWLQSLSAVILESKKVKSVTASVFPLVFSPKVISAPKQIPRNWLKPGCLSWCMCLPSQACLPGKYRIGDGQDPTILTEPDFTAVFPKQSSKANREGLGALHLLGAIGKHQWLSVW